MVHVTFRQSAVFKAKRFSIMFVHLRGSSVCGRWLAVIRLDGNVPNVWILDSLPGEDWWKIWCTMWNTPLSLSISAVGQPNRDDASLGWSVAVRGLIRDFSRVA